MPSSLSRCLQVCMARRAAHWLQTCLSFWARLLSSSGSCTPFGIHVAIVGLPMAGLGYLIGMAVGDKPTEAQLKAIADAGMKISN